MKDRSSPRIQRAASAWRRFSAASNCCQIFAIALIGSQVSKIDQAEGGIGRPRQLGGQIIARDLAAAAFDLRAQGPGIGLEIGELMGIESITIQSVIMACSLVVRGPVI